MQGLREDINGATIQGFAPRRIVEITADAEWTPSVEDRAFRVPVATNYYLSTTGSSRETGLVAGSITVINRAVGSYTFDTTLELEVM